MKTVDVGAMLDEGPWSGYQKLLIFGTALTIILDGVDNQLLGNAVPALMKDWALPRAAFATVLATGPFGMLFGAVLGGMLGDRVGRATVGALLHRDQQAPASGRGAVHPRRLRRDRLDRVQDDRGCHRRPRPVAHVGTDLGRR